MDIYFIETTIPPGKKNAGKIVYHECTKKTANKIAEASTKPAPKRTFPKLSTDLQDWKVSQGPKTREDLEWTQFLSVASREYFYKQLNAGKPVTVKPSETEESEENQSEIILPELDTTDLAGLVGYVKENLSEEIPDEMLKKYKSPDALRALIRKTIKAKGVPA